MAVLAVVSVLGKDQKGVVAQFATYMAERGINIEDIEQRVVRGFFVMDMLVDLQDIAVDLSELITGLLELGRAMDMEVRVHLHSRAPAEEGGPAGQQGAALPPATDRRHSRTRSCTARSSASSPTTRTWSHSPKRRAPVRTGSRHDDLGRPFPVARQDSWRNCRADLVVLARYMRILPAPIVSAFRHKIINIHPSLLPYFPGAAPYKQAYESGVRVHGCTAHFVTEQLDEGPVIMQDVFHINVGADTLDDVKRKGLELEGRVLSKAVQLFLDEELVVVEGKVIFKPGISRFFDKGGEA